MEAGVAITSGVAAVGGQAAIVALEALGHRGLQHDQVVLVTAVGAGPAAELISLEAALLLGPG